MRGGLRGRHAKNIVLGIRSEDLHKAGSLELPSIGAVDMLVSVWDGNTHYVSVTKPVTIPWVRART